jgi:hypothetical protein
MTQQERRVEALHKMVDDFLSERRASDGGWAKVTDADVRDLEGIVRALIEAKCEEDLDGDIPLQFVLVNRLKTEALHFRPLPYHAFQDKGARQADGATKLRAEMNRFNAAMSNIEQASSAASSSYEILKLLLEQNLPTPE